MKLFYKEPEIQLILIGAQDIVTASDGSTENTTPVKNFFGEDWEV